MGLCASGKLFNGILPVVVPAKIMQEPAIEQKKTVKQSPECVICTLIVKQLDQMLNDNATEVCVCVYILVLFNWPLPSIIFANM